jgi:hypothetical protein
MWISPSYVSRCRSASRLPGWVRLVPFNYTTGHAQNLNHPPHPFTPRTNRLLDLREKLFGHLLSANDVRILTPGTAITPRRYPIVDFVLALLSPVQRGPGRP